MEYIDINHNQLAPRVYADLKKFGIPQTSRNGTVRRMPGVTTLVATSPRERVNFSSVRDANPFFHLVEALAMLGVENNVELLSYMAKNMATFSDDGERYNAFYGTRLRQTWGDQLQAVINELREKPDSRQAVAQLWDPKDLTRITKDKACNLCLLFSVNTDGSLEMTSFNRSNDAIWGILSGANVVHLSFFQEYVACALGRTVGTWTHVSNNLHVYTDNPKWETLPDAPAADYYASPADVDVAPLLFEPDQQGLFEVQLARYLLGCLLAIRMGNVEYLATLRSTALPFFSHVAIPVFLTWHLRKVGAPKEVVDAEVHKITAPDWHLACCMWLLRRNGGAT